MLDRKSLPSQEYLKQCFDYNEVTGDLVWKFRPFNHFKNSVGFKNFNNQNAGKVAGSKTTTKEGNHYVTIKIKGVFYFAHRLVFKILYNEEPDYIDHLNGNGLDNSKINLEKSTAHKNNKNQTLNKRNKENKMGVYWREDHGRFCASIGYKGKQIHLGSFMSKTEAINAREKAEKELLFSDNHGRNRK
ncbi:TPA: hypothetical protein ACIBVD_001778 [Salmonella enterica subsp. enterica serovar Javiana]